MHIKHLLMIGKSSEGKQQRFSAEMNGLNRQGSASFPAGKGDRRQKVGEEACMPGRERKKSLAHSPVANWAPAWSNSCFTTDC